MTDFKVVGNGPDFHILTTHTNGPKDISPLQIISDDRLADLLRIEAAAKLAGVACPAPTPASSADGIKSE